MRTRTLCWILMIAGLVLAGCDTAPVDDGLVEVRYTLSSSNGARANVAYLIGADEWGYETAGDGWQYVFRVEEGSQMLYMNTSDVTRGSIVAGIYVDGRLVRSHEHAVARSTEQVGMGSGAWGKSEDIALSYFFRGYFDGGAVMTLPGRVATFPEGEVWTFDEVQADQGFRFMLTASRSSVETSTGCASLNVRYQPVSDVWLELLDVRQCDVAPIVFDYTVEVPGY